MKRVRLKDLIELKTETISPKKNDNYFLYSLPSFDNNKNREYLKGGKIQSNKYKVPNRSILFNKLNVRFKRVWKIDNTDNNKICSTEFLPLVVDENKAYYNFCYYLLISENITNFLCNQNANTSGSHKRIDASMLLELEINLPPLETQQKIAKILSDIDDKIEVLHQINDNLAELAKTIYDYWFVQFDFPDENGKPYKTSGGKMVYNEVLKREIPEGWEVKKLKKYAFIKKGTLITEKQANTNGNIKVVSAGLDFSYYHDKSNFLENTITISASGANAGFINFWREPIFACDCTTVRGNNLTETLYIYQFLKILQDYIYQQAKGSAQPHIYPKDIEDLNIIIPNENEIKKCGEYVNDLNQKILLNLKEIQHLQSLRDWLLPMLMNGQISVE